MRTIDTDEIRQAETIAYATETDADGNSFVRVWADTTDSIWEMVEALRLPVWELAAEGEDEHEEALRWVDGYERIRGGGYISPVYIEDIRVGEKMNVPALLALDAAIWLAGEQGPDESISE